MVEFLKEEDQKARFPRSADVIRRPEPEKSGKQKRVLRAQKVRLTYEHKQFSLNKLVLYFREMEETV